MSDAPLDSVDALLDSLRKDVDAALRALELPPEPADLYDPVRYALGTGGKRLRPLLVLLAAEMFGAARREALPAALSVEVFHNFTLVHDDIMDHSATRRGRPTVHVKWNESTAILAGDYLMALSYRLLGESPAHHVPSMLRTFDEMVGHLCEGQALDKHFESVDQIGLDEYLHMIDRKTGALLRASLELGGTMGNASAETRNRLRRIGEHLGRAFQIQDDLLDLVADDHRWGKRVGGDLIEGKKTYLFVRALERCTGEPQAFFQRIVERGGLEPECVEEARNYLDDAGVLAEASEAVGRHTEAALELIQTIEPDTPARRALAEIVERMRSRVH